MRPPLPSVMPPAIFGKRARFPQRQKPAQAGFEGMPPLGDKNAPAAFGCQGPRRTLADGAACLGLDGQRPVV